ncbi:hypothetical protein [uncultured Oscillibacter sp.]|uniref:hypothetical protein n=1 Tax=uncultured Oscillibacter sp. TaxID=876091 RepID=UPI002620C87F|nr:hypothetical protein [uncultured Oscillibacter sp.]
MKWNLAGVLLAAGLLLALYGCQGPPKTKARPSSRAEPTVAISAAFRWEDGSILSDSSVSFSNEEADHRLDGGTVRVAGLPREGLLTLTVLDERRRPQGSSVLSFSQGAVIDVAAGGDGRQYITLKADTEEISLDFTLCRDGTLLCGLRLTEFPDA